MKDLPKEIADLFYKAGTLSKEDLEQLQKAAEELANDPEFEKEYQKELQEELELAKQAKENSEII